MREPVPRYFPFYAAIALLLAALLLGTPGLRAEDGPWFSIQSTFGHYLQAHTDGETHASNDHRGNEETWIIYKADVQRGTYAIKNARTGRYLSLQEGDCFRANRENVGAWEQFTFEDAGNNWIRIRSARTDYPHLLGANQAGNDTSCGGEVKGQQGSTEWAIRSHSTVEDPGGGVNLGTIISTVGQLANLVKLAASLAP